LSQCREAMNDKPPPIPCYRLFESYADGLPWHLLLGFTRHQLQRLCYPHRGLDDLDDDTVVGRGTRYKGSTIPRVMHFTKLS